ncbi:SAC3/GANP/Nin1/mts3/eIF-3 p25 family-domain-containing protein [Clohesyomyces aquaticus]|uniref:SAC3/GANP/Nin1/mts3/eIF-3 p25 family-domain-containing protein n=1 Tax=Clohesyomyces aquaticus TaxID=1231657 RepID=A0A1Y1Z066_9PLEO|nr:SAC3/GANP/Nin1/mts3/eIF-3 p25 family-domain-containing protein [Clohesyomyces aquaticus]
MPAQQPPVSFCLSHGLAAHPVHGLPQQAAAPPVTKPKKAAWPPAVREYVQRAFEPQNAIEGVTPADMEAKLKQTIQYFAELNYLDQLDWPSYPLPQKLVQDERDAAAAAAVAAPNGYGYAHAMHAAHAMSSVGSANYPSSSFSSSQPSKKRKSADMEAFNADDGNAPPWRKANHSDAHTSTKQEKRHKKNESAGGNSKFYQADLEKRKQRFQTATSATQSTPPWSDSESSMPTGPVVGTNMALEKSYFRLTAPPKPETVRPQHVLEKTLDLLKKKWREESNYNYICNQFKSLRQDLTVQHIKNAFTVSVYEIHARIALEKGDLGEYNQCQTQLRALYAQKLGGHPGEFTAYRILYFVYTCNKTDMNDLLAELTPADKARPEVKHALDVRSALALGNYHRFFRLYLTAPHMGGYLMDMFIKRERLHALANISKAYISVTLRFLTDELGFDSDGECLEFLAACGAQDFIEEKATEKGKQVRVNLRGTAAASVFEGLRAAAFKTVDIKGQI